MQSESGLGLSWLWRLPSRHPLHMAGVWHDACYGIRRGEGLTRIDHGRLTRNEIKLASLYAMQDSSRSCDKYFLQYAEALAGESRLYLMQAKAFYWLTRLYGVFYW